MMRWLTSRPWATKARNFSGAFLGSLLTAARMTAPETALAVRNSPGGTGGASGGARLLPLKPTPSVAVVSPEIPTVGTGPAVGSTPTVGIYSNGSDIPGRAIIPTVGTGNEPLALDRKSTR